MAERTRISQPGAMHAPEREQLLRDALTARAQAEAAQLRAELARTELEAALREAEAARALADAARARHEFLSHAGRRLAATMNSAVALREVVTAAVPVLGDWCVVMGSRPNGTLETLAFAHRDPLLQERGAEIFRRYTPDPASPIGIAAVVRTGEPELVEGVDHEKLLLAAGGDEGRADAFEELGGHSSLIVPLATPSQAIGAIAFVLTDPSRRFLAEDVEVATSLGARTALQMQNARMYAERSHVAQTLQRSLLPTDLPQIPGIEVAARYHASGEHNEVGGDFYDAFAGPDGIWTVFIGDVCGKGAEAAVLTSLTRHTLFAAALRGDDAIAQLELVNAAMRARSADFRFSTLAHVEARLEEGGAARLRVTNAGHPPPLLLRRDGSLEETAASGTVLGAFPDPAFDQQDLRLEAGDTLVLYTDGLTELRTEDPDFGDVQLRETLRAHAGCSAAGIVEALERRVLELQDGRPRDDVAVLALQAVAP